MRFLILSQYFPPETGAPQNRLYSLALNLKGRGHQVQVLTAMPNYPKFRIFESYRNFFFCREIKDDIPIFRSWIFVTKSKAIFPRLLNYFSFVLTSLMVVTKMPSCDYIICESPPLFLGISALIIKKLKRAKLIFNVSDLWPESAEKLDIVKNKFLLRTAHKLEAKIYSKSFLVSGQTQGIVADIKKRFPNTLVHWLPNGIDKKVYLNIKKHVNWRTTYGLEQKKVFIYAGIIGHAQGLEVIIKAAVELKHLKNVAFVIVGDGPVKHDLIELNNTLGASVIFIPNTPKLEVMQMIADSYAYVIPLKKLDLFKGAIPSKIFDPLALSVPIVLGVDGEAKDLFIKKGQSGLYFEPENVNALVEAIIILLNDESYCIELGVNGNNYVNEFFNRENIAESFINQIKLIDSNL